MMSTLLTVQGAAGLLGVHANTVRAWTDQGLLTCLRINSRGDRRYRHDEIDRFLSRAKVDVRPQASANGVEITRRPSSRGKSSESAHRRAISSRIARVRVP